MGLCIGVWDKSGDQHHRRHNDNEEQIDGCTEDLFLRLCSETGSVTTLGCFEIFGFELISSAA